jgi:hypothetical protein
LTKYFHPGLVITREKMAAMHTDLKDLHALRKVSPLHETLIVDDSNEMFGILNPFNCIDAPTYSLNTADHFLDVLPLLIDFHFQNVLSRHTEEQLLALRKDIIQALTSRTPKFAYD